MNNNEKIKNLENEIINLKNQFKDLEKYIDKIIIDNLMLVNTSSQFHQSFCLNYKKTTLGDIEIYED